MIRMINTKTKEISYFNCEQVELAKKNPNIRLEKFKLTTNLNNTELIADLEEC